MAFLALFTYWEKFNRLIVYSRWWNLALKIIFRHPLNSFFPIKCLIGCLFAYTSFSPSLSQLYCLLFLLNSDALSQFHFKLSFHIGHCMCRLFICKNRNLLCNYSVIIIIVIVIVTATYSPSILCAQINHISRMLRVALVVRLMQITSLNSLFKRGYALCICMYVCMWWNASILSWCCSHKKDDQMQFPFNFIATATKTTILRIRSNNLSALPTWPHTIFRVLCSLPIESV